VGDEKLNLVKTNRKLLKTAEWTWAEKVESFGEISK
jgi:hypothetical protein